MLFGCIAMHLGGHKLDADYLCRVSLYDVQAMFGIPLDIDVAVDNGPVIYL